MDAQLTSSSLSPAIAHWRDAVVADLSSDDPVLPLLHNEQLGHAAYPRDLREGRFFPEVVGAANPQAPEYFDRVACSLELIADAMSPDGVIPFEEIEDLGWLQVLIFNAGRVVR
jgi:hypothetical protein